MTIQRFDTDNPNDVQILMEMRHDPSVREVLPRRTKYGDLSALRKGLYPIEAVPDVLVPKDSFKEVIDHCHAEKIFPMYHQRATWAPEGFRSNQNGLNLCWIWSTTGALATTRSMEDKPSVLLAPVSGGKFINWKNAGNYLDDVIEHVRNDGICPSPDGDFNSTELNASFWAPYDGQRKFYRLDKIWDCNNEAGDEVMLQHSLSIASYGRPILIAYDFWGHALYCVGFRWDPSAYLSVVPVIQNSHDEDDFIEVTGSKSIFSEAYGFISTVNAE